MRAHRRKSKQLHCQSRKLYECFNTVGINNFYIGLIENHACQNKEQLAIREGYYIRSLAPSLNIKVAGRTKSQYNEEFKEQRKHYYEDNIEKLIYGKHNTETKTRNISNHTGNPLKIK